MQLNRCMSCKRIIILLLAALTTSAQTFVTPKLGGGQVAADMVHVNIVYDADSNQLQAVIDDTYGIPELRVLDPGYSFDPAEAYVVLNGKAYNAQYGWNAGGFFTIPPGAAIWVEAKEASPGLEVYEGSGRFASYAPLFGTAGSSGRWRWSGVMVHNTHAVRNPIDGTMFAEYHVYFGDAASGEPLAQYGDTYVRLEWTTVPLQPPLPLEFGAALQTNGSPLGLQNAFVCTTNSEYLVNLKPANTAQGVRFEAEIPLTSLAATPVNGGPVSGHALPGSCIDLELTRLTGPAGASLQFFETAAGEPRFTVPVGELGGTNRIRISGGSSLDPYGNIQGRRFVASQPGLYCLTFRAVDSSTNCVHQPSQLYSMYLQAGVTICSLALTNQTAILTFGGERGTQFLLEASPRMTDNATWKTIAGPIAGTNYLQRLTCNLANENQNFFRIRAIAPVEP